MEAGDEQELVSPSSADRALGACNIFSLKRERAFVCRESTVVGKGVGCSVDCAFFSSGEEIIYQC